MANAIYKTLAGDTLESIVARFYALTRPDGRPDRFVQKRVLLSIRHATPATITDLSSIEDNEVISSGSTIFVPTIPGLSKNLLVQHTALEADLRANGFESAKQILKFTPAEIEALLTPLSGYTTATIERAWTLCGFFTLDGMSPYVAEKLYDGEGITSMEELAEQSVATLDAFLAQMVGSPHNQPAALEDQRHSERWPLSARIRTRNRVSELTKIREQRYRLPIRASDAARQATFFENRAQEDTLTTPEANLARRLTRLYRFQEAVLKGNRASLSGRWASAVESYQQARRQFHRLVEELGVASSVSDEAGVNLSTALSAAEQLLLLLPAEDERPLGAPELTLQRAGLAKQRRFRLRSFRYGELNTSGTDRKTELRNALTTSAPKIHQMPRLTRSALFQGTLDKSRSALNTVNPNLISGLLAGFSNIRARDLEPQDREVLRRNLNGSTIIQFEMPVDPLGAMGGGEAVGRFQPTTASFARTQSQVIDTIAELWEEVPANKRQKMTASAARSEITTFVDQQYSFSLRHTALPVQSERFGGVISIDPRLKSGPLTFDGETATIGSTAAHELLLHAGAHSTPTVSGTYLGVPLKPIRPSISLELSASLQASPSVESAIKNYNIIGRETSIGHNAYLYGMGYPK